MGFKNFVKIWNDSIFQRAAYNTFVYTGIATVGKLALGMWLALLLNRHFKGKRLVRASMLLPFIVPTVLSTFAWKWMFDPTFSVLNWSLYHAGAHPDPDRLADRPDAGPRVDHHRQRLARACRSTPSRSWPGSRR